MILYIYITFISLPEDDWIISPCQCWKTFRVNFIPIKISVVRAPWVATSAVILLTCRKQIIVFLDPVFKYQRHRNVVKWWRCEYIRRRYSVKKSGSQIAVAGINPWVQSTLTVWKGDVHLPLYYPCYFLWSVSSLLTVKKKPTRRKVINENDSVHLQRCIN